MLWIGFSWLGAVAIVAPIGGAAIVAVRGAAGSFELPALVGLLMPGRSSGAMAHCRMKGSGVPEDAVLEGQQRRADRGRVVGWFDTGNWKLASGRIFDLDEQRAGAAVCVIGETVRREIYDGTPGRTGFGERLRIKQFSCDVVGILVSNLGPVNAMGRHAPMPRKPQGKARARPCACGTQRVSNAALRLAGHRPSG